MAPNCKHVILVGNYFPYDSCELNDPYNPEKIHGIEVEVVRGAINVLNFTEGVDICF
jgi:hypothetical protein